VDREHKIRLCKPNIIRQKYYNQKQSANAEGKQFEETVEIITSACPILAKEQYI
jgi:hypothetical protein